jgi:hypothetical protein
MKGRLTLVTSDEIKLQFHTKFLVTTNTLLLSARYYETKNALHKQSL